MKYLIHTLLAVVSFVALTVAHAAETKPFDQKTFDALQAAGKPVLIDVYADWCPTCKQQAPILSQLLNTPEFKDFTVLKVNFDTQKDVRQVLHGAQQSTFICFRGKREVARTVGDTGKDSIAATLRKASS